MQRFTPAPSLQWVGANQGVIDSGWSLVDSDVWECGTVITRRETSARMSHDAKGDDKGNVSDDDKAIKMVMVVIISAIPMMILIKIIMAK